MRNSRRLSSIGPDLDHKTPGAIVFPATEEDIVKIVSFAINPSK